MRFGESLARLAVDIGNGHAARNVLAGTRADALSVLRDEVERTVNANTSHRMALANDLAARAAVLRESLAATNAARGAEVRRGRAAARRDLDAKRERIAANATALRAGLDASRRRASAAVTAFRAETRAEQATAAAAFTDALARFVADVRHETAQIQSAVQGQFQVARAAWGKPAPAAEAASAAAHDTPGHDDHAVHASEHESDVAAMDGDTGHEPSGTDAMAEPAGM